MPQNIQFLTSFSILNRQHCKGDLYTLHLDEAGHSSQWLNKKLVKTKFSSYMYHQQQKNWYKRLLCLPSMIHNILLGKGETQCLPSTTYSLVRGNSMLAANSSILVLKSPSGRGVYLSKSGAMKSA